MAECPISSLGFRMDDETIRVAVHVGLRLGSNLCRPHLLISYAMAIEHVELHVEFQGRLQTLIDRAHEQDSNFHDRWR